MIGIIAPRKIIDLPRHKDSKIDLNIHLGTDTQKETPRKTHDKRGRPAVISMIISGITLCGENKKRHICEDQWYAGDYLSYLPTLIVIQ